jgi:hypothetical protein
MSIIHFIQTLFKSSAKAEACVPYVEVLINSPTTHALFKSMSFSYRFIFVESLMKIYDMVHQGGKLDIYTTICHGLSEAPYSMYFFSVFVDKFCPKMSDKKGENSEIDNFIPLLSDALDATSNEDIEFFIKYCCVSRDIVNTAGARAPFENKWWLRDQKSIAESKRTSMPDAAETMCMNYPNCESEDCKYCNDATIKYRHKDLELLIEKFQKRVESDKNYNFYTQEPASGLYNEGSSSFIN